MNAFFDGHLKTLEATERAPPDNLARYQAELLESLARHAHANAPFYRERLACLFDAAGNFDLSRWYDVPILDRAAAAAHAGEMRVGELDADRYGGVADMWTSGTTGTPLTFATNGLMSISSNAAMARVARWFGLDRRRSHASIRMFGGNRAAPYPDGKVSQSWIIGEIAPHYMLDSSTPIEHQAEWLKRIEAPYLTTYPSNAIALCETVSADEGRALGIEMIFAVGETVPDGTHEMVAERLGAHFSARYSCQEIGTMAIECPARHYHIMVENALVEIVDEQCRQVLPGERGQVVVTGLYNYATPFIRYALGDIAVASADMCPCGRTLPLIGRIEGRVRHAFTFRDGTRVWPRTQLARQMQGFVPFRRYQIVQLDHERIELRYVPDGSGRAPDVEGLNAFLRKAMHPTVTVAAVALDMLPRTRGGKFEDFYSLVPPGRRGARLRPEPQ